MTRAELNTYIDTNITDKTEVDTLSPTDEANALKAVADYSESITISKVRKTSITAAQLLAIFDTPITIIPSAGAGKMIIPKIITIIIRFNTATYSNPGGAWRVMMGVSPIQLATITSYLAAATFDRETVHTLFYSSFTTSGTFIDAPLLLTTTASNPLDGDSSIDVYVSYDEVII